MIVRTSGAPVFYLANAVDDADTGITHVIRGEDLTDTTHRMLALREALADLEVIGPGRPVFAHLPLLVGADRAKLSKRHGAISLEDFAERGYLPEALANYLGLLGFSLPAGDDGASREIASLAELAAEFDLARVAPSPASFDYDKLNWINGEYIRALSPAEFAERCRPFGEARYGAPARPGRLRRRDGHRPGAGHHAGRRRRRRRGSCSYPRRSSPSPRSRSSGSGPRTG